MKPSRETKRKKVQMTRFSAKLKISLLLFAAVYCIGVSRAEEPKGVVPKGLEGFWDPAKYISIDEVRPGMEAWTLTVYKGVEVEKFPLEVLSVVYDFTPGRNVILVRSTDERFIHSGPVAGCSGSPVYINGRLAGALALGWMFSKDPLYGVTPIEDMFRVGESQAQHGGATPLTNKPGLTFDFSSPLDFTQVQKKISTSIQSSRPGFSSATTLPSPLVVSGLPESIKGDLDDSFGPLGFMVIPGGGGRPGTDVCDVKLAPGSCLMVPVVTGDITLDVVGTVTEVKGDEVYGFGHSFLGYGAVDLPMATGQVHTVVSSVMRSFKLATSVDIVGALTMDESRAVRGRLSAQARMIPLTMRISRYNDPQTRLYHCQVADNRILTPLLVRIVASGATLLRGSLPPDNTIQYKGNIELDGFGAIAFENISTAAGLNDMIRDSISPVALLMNNPYRQVRIKSIDLDVRVSEKNVTAAIWSVGLSKSRVKPGENFEVQVVTESFQADKRSFPFDLVVPENTPDGTYQLIICGSQGYEEFLRKTVPHRFTTENLESLVATINDILAIGRDELHCILVLPRGGVALEQAELPELPATKAMVLGDAKRANTMQVYPGWIDKKIRTGSVIIDQKIMNVTVEQ
jgi:hypothetical protein